MAFDDDVHEPPDGGGDWVRFPLNAHSTREEIDAYIADQIRVALDSFREQLEADEVLNFKNRPRDRAAVLVRAEELLAPIVRKNVEQVHAKTLLIQ